MAFVLKSGKTFEDVHGNVYEDAYAVIDQCNGNKKDKIQHFVLEIYKDKTTRDNKKTPIGSYTYDLFDENFNTWFAVDNIIENQYKTAYNYLLQLTTSVQLEDGSVSEVLVWGDWESDI